MEHRRAVISGIGVVSPIGTGREAFWSSLVSGRSGIRRIQRFDSSDYPVHVAGEVEDFKPLRYMDKSDFRRLAEFAHFAIAAGCLAVEDANLTISQSKRAGACFASSISGFTLVPDDVPAYDKRGSAGLSPFHSTTYATHTATSAVCSTLGLEGPKASISSGCTSGIDVVGWALEQIQSNRADILVTGCSDAPLTPFAFALLCASRGFSTSIPAPRPFDLHHDGGAVSEGGIAVVVEELNHALERGAPIYAEVVGQASAGETGDFFKEAEGDSGLRAIQKAMQQSEFSVQDIDCICPLAPGAPAVDTVDCKTIRAVLGQRALNIPVPGIESMLGHMVSASSLAQVCAMVLAIKHQTIPPTIHYESPAAECDLDHVSGKARRSRLDRVVVFSQSLNKTASAITLRRFFPVPGAPWG